MKPDVPGCGDTTLQFSGIRSSLNDVDASNGVALSSVSSSSLGGGDDFITAFLTASLCQVKNYYVRQSPARPAARAPAR